MKNEINADSAQPFFILHSSLFIYSSSFFLRIERLRVFFFSSPGLSVFIPASSGSMRIRPQYSQTITFLCILMSSCLCGGILLKQPPQASRCTYTMPSPLRAFLRIRLKEARRRGSILVSSSFTFIFRRSSSARVSSMMSSSSLRFRSS